MAGKWWAPTPRVSHFLSLLLGAIILIFSYTVYRLQPEFTFYRNHLKQIETNQVATDLDDMSELLPAKDELTSRIKREISKIKQEVKDVLIKLDQVMPNVSFTNISTTTSAKTSQATIVNLKDSYCVGDHLRVRLDLYDHLGKRKAYGGDFLRARIYSLMLKAGASGFIQDFKNGTYLVDFTLFWEGNVNVSLLLFHPSEAVSSLWAARKKGYDKITFVGKFLNGASEVNTTCGFKLIQNLDLCTYLDERDQEAFYCVKPKNLSCDAFVRLTSLHHPISYLTALEWSLLTRFNIGVKIRHKFGEIHVVPCERHKTITSTKCWAGMNSPVPSGYVWQNQWHPAFCSMSSFNTSDHIDTCLEGKLIYFMGDSTVRQWFLNLEERASTLHLLDTKEKNQPPQKFIGVDIVRNIRIQFKKHGHPYVASYVYSVKDHSYVARELDRIAGDKDTTVVISLGQHFRPFPIELFIRRAISVRRAILRLLLRSPETKVIIKGENNREMTVDPERFGDFHGYTQHLTLKDVLADLPVGFIDSWDITGAYNMNQVHPSNDVVGNLVNMFLSYMC